MKKITQENVSNFRKNLTTKFDELREQYQKQQIMGFDNSISTFISVIEKLEIPKEDKLLLFDVLEEVFDGMHNEYVSQWNDLKDTEDDDAKLLAWPPAQNCIELKRCFSSWRKNIENPEIRERANRAILDMLN